MYTESCDPGQLTTDSAHAASDANAPLVRGIHGEVVEAHRAVTASKLLPVRQIAFVVFVLGALPWAWYFLLRRIAELRAAISGNPPTG